MAWSKQPELPTGITDHVRHRRGLLDQRSSASAGRRSPRFITSTGGAVTLLGNRRVGYGSLLVAQNRALFSFGVFAVSESCVSLHRHQLPAALAL
jgi:hypothetical protein